MGTEERIPQPNLPVWKYQLFLLDGEQLEDLYAELVPGDGKKLVESVCNGNCMNGAGKMLQRMLFFENSAIFGYPILISRKRNFGSTTQIFQRELFINELEQINATVSSLGINHLREIPEDPVESNLLVLGAMSNQLLFLVHQIDIGLPYYTKPKGYGEFKAIFYSGNYLQRIYILMGQNECPITDAKAILETGRTLLQLNGEPSLYERRRNSNVARCMLNVALGEDDDSKDPQQTNAEMLRGICIGGVLRDFKLFDQVLNAVPWSEIPIRLSVWQDLMSSSRKPLEIAEMAFLYNQIHPWRDANGRSMTKEVNRLRHNAGLDLLYIPPERNVEYIQSVNVEVTMDTIERLAGFYEKFALPRTEFIQKMKTIILENSACLDS
jgi:hypothetical protein